MIFIDADNKNRILTFIPMIQREYTDWHIITLKFDAKSREEAERVVNNFMFIYRENDGFVYLDGMKKAVSVMNLGQLKSYSEVQDSIARNVQGKSCKVLARGMSPNGLKQIQINLLESVSEGDGHLFSEREQREKNVILLAEDDMFVRQTLRSLLSDMAEVHEVEKGDEVLSIYKKINPDVVILDIHMPNINGLEVVDILHKEDPSVFILVFSSDSIKNNVLMAAEKGAVGFLAKPVRKDKLFGYLDQCITFRKEELCKAV